eukprot:CAMPEP_0115335970 /NCGR_PEP_ID=MMETSP0270-20121206/88751_1 /TAXON_ID=71861 /ORGANISM="Scrippsiella trochoidea, Strain CCMP3099" /LENGTH=171 /DNA_ID=CAMNT_0002757101 /DNA_START=319 /DNA_END=831 /DNA_ORIENTATION=-
MKMHKQAVLKDKINGTLAKACNWGDPQVPLGSSSKSSAPVHLLQMMIAAPRTIKQPRITISQSMHFNMPHRIRANMAMLVTPDIKLYPRLAPINKICERDAVEAASSPKPLVPLTTCRKVTTPYKTPVKDCAAKALVPEDKMSSSSAARNAASSARHGNLKSNRIARTRYR